MTKKVKPEVTQVEIIAKDSLYKDAKAIEKAIKVAHTSQKDLQQEYQRIAVSTIMVLDKHRDISVVRNLFTEMTVNLPESMRVDAMQAFFVKYSPVTFDPKTNEVKFDKKGTTDLTGAMTNPWWLSKKRQFLKPFDLQLEIADLYKRAIQRHEKPKTDESGNTVHDLIDIADLNALKKLIKVGNTGKSSKDIIKVKEAKEIAF